MLTKAEIKSYTRAVTYSKGLELYKRDKVIQLDINAGTVDDIVHAMVSGSRRNIYDVEFSIEKESDQIFDSYCSCPAYSSYTGLCKHCVAALLEYIDYKERQITITEYLNNPKKDIKKKKNPKLPQTTSGLKQLLELQVMKKALPYLADENYGNIRIEVLLEYGYDEIVAGFKIGYNHMYVMKDVFDFAKHVKDNAKFAYGKKLEFVHTIEAFDEQTKPLVKFICDWAANHETEYQEPIYRYGYGYDTQTKKLRNLPLKGYELEELLEILEPQDFSMKFYEMPSEIYRITQEPIEHKIYMRGKKHGMELELDYIPSCMGKNYEYYFQNHKVYKVPAEKMAATKNVISCIEENGGKAYIQKEDIPAFCREILPNLEKSFLCVKENFDVADYGVPEAAFEIYLDAPEKDFITCKLFAAYGETKFNVYAPIEDIGIRDIAKEIEISNIVSSYCNAYDENENVMVLAEDEDKLYELLTEGISKFQELGEVFISDTLKKINISDTPKLTVGVSLSGNLLELKLTSGEMPKEQLIEILSAYKKKKKFYRLKNGDFINIEDESMEILQELKDGLNITDKQLKQEKISVPKYRALYLDAELKEKHGVPIVKNKDFKALVRNMKTVEDNDFEVPEKLSGVLREYQKTGFLWMKTLKNNGFCGILADDMGLGKTLQVITFLQSEIENMEAGNKRCLIVSPASLVYNWQSEIERFAPDLSVKVLAGTVAEREELLNELDQQDIVLTSYDLLKRDIELYQNITFGYQVIDEAQYIKNHNTQAAHAVKMIQADYKLALTGTPVENRLSELWSIFDYLMPGFLYSYKKFREEIELPIVQNSEAAVIARLQKMIRPFILRRLKREVLKDLPEKLEKNMYAKMEGEQQQIYDANVKRLQLLLDKQSEEEFKNSKLQILSELTKLRQICCDPSLTFEDYKGNSTKTDMCMDLIKNAVSSGHKILLFSQFTSMLENLEKCMEKDRISYYTLTGSTPKEKRRKLVEQFNQDDTSVFCISLKAGGTGLNLTSADIVIHYDPWWNLAVQNQATDRAHRIGQKNIVTVYKLIAKGTIEENIVRLQDKKKELADQILSGEGMDSGSFSREELLELLSAKGV